ncbi:MAG TPA: alpha/beta hydrolase [Pseudonocardiaceae bacterium]|nr:alpha/beta hydrolase [Pseudonocardiaceae bacterium]
MPSDLTTSTVLPADTTPQIEPSEADLKFESDIVYARRGELELKLDVIGHGPGRRPLVVYVSGGGFILSLRSSARDLRAYVAAAGFVVASIDYRALSTAPGVTYADTVADVKSAIRFLRTRADQYGIDPENVAVWGESAGGYLAAMTGATNGGKHFVTEDNFEVSSDVQAVVDKFGSSSMAHVADDFDEPTRLQWTDENGLLATYVHGPGGGPLDDREEAVTRANPITYLGQATPPFLLFHGSEDVIVSPSQTLLLHEALRARGIESERYVLKGANHGDAPFLGDPAVGLPWSTTTVMDIIVNFLQARLNS